MKRSRYEETAGTHEPPKDYYGMTQAEWYGLTSKQRITHYNRNRPAKCEHPFVYQGIEGNVNDDRLLEQQSLDPYANTAHMLPHDVDLYRLGRCECQTCAGHFGIPRGEERRAVDVDALKAKLRGGMEGQ